MKGHTPGPWHFDRWNWVWNEVGDPIAHVMGGSGTYESDETRANSSLVAAAPDLLHACHLIAENAPKVAKWLRANDLKAFEQVEAAIAKAEGR